MGRPKTEPRGNGMSRRDEILAAAEACFREHGVGNTTMEDVARSAGLSRATVYRHFNSRESLLLDITLLRSRGLLERGAALMEKQPDMGSALAAAMVYAVAEFPRDPWVREVMNLDPTVALSSEPMMELARAAFRPFVVRYRARGELRNDIDLDELVMWIVRQAFVIYRGGNAGEDEIRREVRVFLVPALQAPPGPTTAPLRGSLRDVADRLERLERRMELLTDAVAAVDARSVGI